MDNKELTLSKETAQRLKYLLTTLSNLELKQRDIIFAGTFVRSRAAARDLLQEINWED